MQFGVAFTVVPLPNEAAWLVNSHWACFFSLQFSLKWYCSDQTGGETKKRFLANNHVLQSHGLIGCVTWEEEASQPVQVE